MTTTFVIIKHAAVAVTLVDAAEGRGQIITHALYQDQEMDKVRTRAAEAAEAAAAGGGGTTTKRSTSSSSSSNAALEKEVADLKTEVARLRGEIEDIWKNING